MEQFKRAQVIMLPTHQSNIALTNSIKEYAIGSHRNEDYLQGGGKWIYQSDMSGQCKPHHLYIISDDEIKKGDRCLTGLKIVRQCSGFTYSQDGKTLNGYTFTDGTADTFSSCKKIIATTDSSLHIPFVTPGNEELDIYEYNILPEPSQQFIKKYIECYNKGEIITNILVEYEMRHTGWTIDQSEYTYDEFLKVNPKNNTITIKSIKDSWNREEVYILLYNIWDDSIGMNKPIDEEFNKWIEQNL